MLMACSGHQFVFCRRFTYRNIIPPTMEFYITKLDKGYSVVLSYEWLVCHNLSIDWAETKVVFLESVKAPEGPSTPIKPEFNIQFVSAKNISHLVHKPGNSVVGGIMC